MYVTSYCLCFCSIIFPYPPLASSLQFPFSGIEIAYHQHIFCSKIWFLKLVIVFFFGQPSSLPMLERGSLSLSPSKITTISSGILAVTKLLYTKEQRMLISSNLRQVVECIFSLFTTKEVNSSYSHLTWKQRGITDSRTNPLLTTSSIAALKVHSFGRAPVGQNFSSFPALINWGTYSRGSVSQRIPAMQLRRSLGLMQTSLELSLVG